jgi:hypothetical protein
MSAKIPVERDLNPIRGIDKIARSDFA